MAAPVGALGELASWAMPLVRDPELPDILASGAPPRARGHLICVM